MTIAEIAVAVGGTLALPLVFKLLKGKVLDLAIGYAVTSLTKGLKGEGLSDPLVKEFVHDVTIAFVKLAEAKLPDEGLGADRKAFVRNILTKIPILKGQDARIDELIEAAVKKMDERLKELKTQ